MARIPEPDRNEGLVQRLLRVIEAEKTLAGPVVWRQENDKLTFRAGLDIAGATVPGITLFGRTGVMAPDRDVSLGLTWAPPVGRRPRNFERLDWRPLSIHINKAIAPGGLAWLTLEGSHIHLLAQNIVIPGGLDAALDDNLPVAAPFPEDEPANWVGIARFAAGLWRINGLADAPEPPWQYGLNPPAGRPRRQGRRS